MKQWKFWKLIEPGCTDFNRLNDACFILIAPFDIFGRGLYRYTFEGTCKECPDLRIQDGATRILIKAFVDEGIPKERIIERLKSGFSISEQEALDYFNNFSEQSLTNF